MSINQARQKNLLTQKDLMARWDVDSVRTIQRHRKRFGLRPVDFYGINPLFRLEDVERLEADRLKDGLQRLERQQNQGKQCAKKQNDGILSTKQLRAIKGKAAK